MGYIPPRAQRPDESDAEYIAYLEGLLHTPRLGYMAIAATVLLALVLVGIKVAS